MSTSQLSLIPDHPPEVEVRTIDLSDLPPDTALVGPPPSKALVNAIRLHGMLGFPNVTRVGKRYEVLDGRRRIKAARLLGMESIPCLVVSLRGPAPRDVLSISGNALRSPNPASDFRAISSLSEQGYSEAEIALATGMAVGTVKARVRLLSGLVKGLRNALEDGLLSVAQADAVSKLSSHAQERLSIKLGVTGKLKPADIEEERRVRRLDATASLPWDAINSVPDDTFSEEHRDAVAKVRAFLGGAGVGSPEEDLQSGIFFRGRSGGAYRVIVVPA